MNEATRNLLQVELNRKRIDLRNAQEQLLSMERNTNAQRAIVEKLKNQIEEIRQDLEAADGVLA
jgi:CII-binding regulator of phage lambda lysogenization HflD